MRRFLLDALTSALACAVLLAVSVGVFGLLPMGMAFALAFTPILGILLIAAVFVGPGYFVLRSALKGRLGIAVGPIVLFVLAPAIATLMTSADVRSVELATSRGFRPPALRHNVVVLANRERCDFLCLQILALSDYDVFVGSERYHQTAGPSCYDGSHPASITLDFLRAGYADVCASVTASAVPDSTLVIRELEVSDRNRHPDMPPTFSGTVYELFEETNGRENLLGRWAHGRVGSRVPGILLMPAAIMMRDDFVQPVGSIFPPTEFYAAALSIPLVDSGVPGQSDPRILLDRIGRINRAAIELYDADQLIELLQQKAKTIDGFDEAERTTGTARRERISAAASELAKIPASEAAFAARYVERLLQSDDPFIVAAAIPMLHSLPPTPFATDFFVRSALEPMTEQSAVELTPLLIKYSSLAHPAPLAEARLKEGLSSDAALRPIQRWLMLRMLATSDRRGTVELLFSLRDRPYEESVRAAKTDRIHAIPSADPQHSPSQASWTYEECNKLITRTSDVSIAGLVSYVQAIHDQCPMWALSKPQLLLLDLLRERRDTLKAQQPQDNSSIVAVEAVLRRFDPGSATP